MIAQLLVSAAVIGAFAFYQINKLGSTSYYFNKLMIVGYVACLIGLGALGSFLRPLHARARRDGRPGRLPEAGLAVAAGAVALSLAIVVQSSLSGVSPLVWVRSGLANWSAGKVQAADAPSLITLTDAGLLGDGVPTVVFDGNTRTDQYDNFYAAAANHDLGVMSGTFNTIRTVFAAGAGAHVSAGRRELLAARRVIRESTFPLRLVLADPVIARKLAAAVRAQSRNLGAKATVLVLRSLRVSGALVRPSP